MASRLKKSYLQYLESGHWRSLRKEAFKRDNFECQICGSSRWLRGHHKRYRKDLRKCTVDDIQTLCKKCHDEHHKQKAKERKEHRKIRRERGVAAWRKLLNLPGQLFIVQWE